MRRFLASLLLALFGLAPVAPLVAANASLDLPSCCRRDGKHHCAMDGAGSPSQPGGPAATSKCPLFPQSLFTPHSPSAATIGFSQRAAAALAATSVSLHASGLSLLLIPTRAIHKRGPPRLL